MDSLLYISPVIPDVTGNGLAMRAGTVLDALSRHYAVSLLVVPLYPPYTAPIPTPILACCRESAVLPSPHAPALRELASFGTVLRQLVGLSPGRDLRFWRRDFSVIHTFRLASVPHARPYLDRFRDARHHLDLDDIESVTHRRLADLYRQNGHETLALVGERHAERYRVAENEALGTFDRVYVCSETDRERLRGRGGAEVVVLPNAVRPPTKVERPRRDGPFTLLFLGNLTYYPNEDAVRYLCTDILPALRRHAPRPFRLTVVGSVTDTTAAVLRKTPDVHVTGLVAEVAPYYRQADVVVVPLRAGGGTRIKVLEAFGFGTPVVSTSVGVEGIDVEDGCHVLVADTAEGLAAQCARLMSDGALAARLAANAWELLNRAYTIDVLARIVATPSSPPDRRGRRSAARSPSPR